MKTNEQVAEEITNKIYSKLCDFYNDKMIHVPISLSLVILEETKAILDKHVVSKYAVESLQKVMRKHSRSPEALNVLLKHGTGKVWTIKGLADESKIAASAIHKLKHRLLFLGVIESSSKGKIRFCLTEKGQKQLANIS